MYRNHFGLRERPFSIAPDPYYLFMSEQHREALAHLLYGIEQSGGFILLSGEVGTGKTTICRCLLEKMPEDTEFAFVMNTKVTAAELLETVCHEFGIALAGEGASAKNCVDRINAFLLDIHSRGRKAVLIIDEAQNLDMDVLEQVRLLTNLETSSSKLLQIILLGQPELRQKLEQPGLVQLAQRITARYHLAPLTESETAQYITHRLNIAGATRQIFTGEAITSAYQLSKGVPRLINLICDRALLGAYSFNAGLIDAGIVKKAAVEVMGGDGKGKMPTRAKEWQRAAIMTVIAVILLGGASLFVSIMKKDGSSLSLPPQEKHVGKKEEPPALPVEPQSLPEPVAAPVPPPLKMKAEEPQKEAETVSSTALEEPPVPLSPKHEETTAPPILTEAAMAETLPFNLMPWKNETGAYEALFSLWGLNYSAADGLPCRYAEKNGLRCYAGNGSFDELRRIDIPVCLRLEAPATKEKMILNAVLTAINGDRAMLRSGAESVAIPLKELIHSWAGQYVLLWRPPSGYSDSVRPGHSGEIVSWIDRSLAKTEGRPLDGHGKLIYDDELMRRVKEFQFLKELTSDGIAGSLTLIHLHVATDGNVPRLTKDH